MMTEAEAIREATRRAKKTNEFQYVVYDPSALTAPRLAYYVATEDDTQTFYAGCEIVATICSAGMIE